MKIVASGCDQSVWPVGGTWNDLFSFFLFKLHHDQSSTLYCIAFFLKMCFVIIIMVETEHSCTINTIVGTNKHSSGLLVHAIKWSFNRPQRGRTVLSFILYAVIKILNFIRTNNEDLWSEGHVQASPVGSAQHQQKARDFPKTSALAESLLESAPDSRARARLLASTTKESGAWLQALPITSLGLRMDDGTIRVAAGLCLGAPLCRPHFCHHCGAEVDSLATHGLSCRWSEGRHHRHAEMNDIIHRALVSAKVPSRQNPNIHSAFLLMLC